MTLSKRQNILRILRIGGETRARRIRNINRRRKNKNKSMAKRQMARAYDLPNFKRQQLDDRKRGGRPHKHDKKRAKIGGECIPSNYANLQNLWAHIVLQCCNDRNFPTDKIIICQNKTPESKLLNQIYPLPASPFSLLHKRSEL